MLQSSSTQKNPVSWQHKRQESILLKLLKITVGLEGLVIPRKLSTSGGMWSLITHTGRTLNIDRSVNTSLPLVNESTKFIKTCVEYIIINIKHRGSTPLASTNLTYSVSPSLQLFERLYDGDRVVVSRNKTDT